ncbi:MAG: 1,6-anhydro-N-acetylmuramyl-L-alanine amidase AmpD [Magnetococcales bacterium]|nr:1,6-anhydro-N-acetylmuramyl-L-alanine amidase AmpD [Magnetococcales bacterium]
MNPLNFRYLPSPHRDPRPAGTTVELLVVHAISLPPGGFGGSFVDDLFLGRLDPAAHPFFATLAGLRVSAHFFLDRYGALTQFVPVGERAWHAGVSRWRGRERCNDFSLGVELEGDESNPFTDGQYRHLAALVRTLQQRLPDLADENIAGHQEIAPGRKWDPGPGFDWDRFRQQLADAAPFDGWQPVWG